RRSSSMRSPAPNSPPSSGRFSHRCVSVMGSSKPRAAVMSSISIRPTVDLVRAATSESSNEFVQVEADGSGPGVEISSVLARNGPGGSASRPYTSTMSGRLTHLDPLGRARMVDVTPKEPTHRRAVARGRVHMQPDTTALVARAGIGKGDVLSVARVAGIQADKRTPDLIPLCHPLLIGSILVNFHIDDEFIEVEAHVDTVDRTGVEMEALTACSVAALTIYDMC